MVSSPPAILRQFAAFFGVGVIAVLVHYAILIALVEAMSWRAVPAAVAGYVAGGIVSYGLNRTGTFASDRPHAEAGWRFAAVMAVGFGLTLALMTLFVDRLGLPYLPSQVVVTGVVFVWNFVAHKWWTFGRS